MSKGEIYLFCGKMGSGKSTLARGISKQNSSVLLSEDSLLGTLYPDQILDIPTYIEFSGRLKLAMAPILVDLLRAGTSVVWDFPANTTKQREWIKDIIIQADSHHEFHYLDCSDAICKTQIQARAVNEPERNATDTVEMFEAITRYFEPPTSDEGFEIVVHKRV